MGIIFPYRVLKLSKLWQATPKKMILKCKFGPLKDHKLHLESPSTLTFKLKGRTGYYKLKEGYLTWVSSSTKKPKRSPRPEFELNA